MRQAMEELGAKKNLLTSSKYRYILAGRIPLLFWDNEIYQDFAIIVLL